MEKRELRMGGDVSELSYVEECGGHFYTQDGQEKDLFQIFAENGINIVRIRNYNNPGKGRGWTNPDTKEGFYRRDYTSTLQDNLNLMKRAKNAGMQIEFSFHYSDYWTNDYTQIIPHAWQTVLDDMPTELAVECLEELIYDYTITSLEAMKQQDTLPEYISIGNEIQSGILFPYGYCSHFGNLARFLNAGAKAVRKVAPKARIVLHLDDACNKFKYGIFLGNCKDYQVDYDVIGISYYPYWTGKTVDQLVEFCDFLVDEFDRDILIMETGYNFAPTLPDGAYGQLITCGPYENSYGSSPEGQQKFMQELVAGMHRVKNDRCIGDLYWDPIMVEQEGVGWAVLENGDQITDNIVSNTTLFDFEHKALPVMEVYHKNKFEK